MCTAFVCSVESLLRGCSTYSASDEDLCLYCHLVQRAKGHWIKTLKVTCYLSKLDYSDYQMVSCVVCRYLHEWSSGLGFCEHRF